MFQRQEITLSEGWTFSRDKTNWENVIVPHDWAISGPFDKKWDIQFVAIEQNGETEKTEKTARSGALPWIGEGYYQITINLPKGYKHAELHFDGAMSEPTVTVNGKKAGYWAYGYNAFNVDITPFAKEGENKVEVDLKNVEESSRWYPGGGIYRPVTLVLTGATRFETWSTFVRTASATADNATIAIDSKLDGFNASQNNETEFELHDKDGKIITSTKVKPDNQGQIHCELKVTNPHLWSPETPYLYNLICTHKIGGEISDKQTIRVGIRTISVSKEHGFQLNGQTRKFKGVCLHHDEGPLGAAENRSAFARQILTMKEMGCDSIRTAHNMPSTMQMELCDELGMMVMAESFDMWIYPKCKNGYARFFKDWGDKDITNLVLHHRNHPSIVMWSIGNEIPEQSMPEGPGIAKHLQDLCHQLDPTRPVTQGLDRIDEALDGNFASVMDIPGFNYRVHKYLKGHEVLPQGFLLGSETASTVSSRGVYKFPVELSDWKQYPDCQCNGYDTNYCFWSNLPDDDWVLQDDYNWTIGEFVWTGYDYLGEPTPYDEFWPSRSSYFGICDLAGLPKDRYYLYRSKWNKKDHTIHILPHWNWPDRVGQITPVYCYTDGVEGELFINGKSQGRIKKNKDSRLDRFRLRWNEVKYEPGEVKVVVYDEKGNKIGEAVRKTTGDPANLKLDVECPLNDGLKLKANGEDMAFITVSLTDKDGLFCPTSSDDLVFEVSGDGKFQACCNGDATSLEVFTKPQMKLFNGQCVVVVRSTKKAGTMKVKVTDKANGLSNTVEIKTT